MKRIAKVLDIDGEFRENPDSPIAVVREEPEAAGEKVGNKAYLIVDPIFNHNVTGNLFGRVMTLVEATCDTHKLKAVKDLFGKELREWESEVYKCARELAEGKNYPGNMYKR